MKGEKPLWATTGFSIEHALRLWESLLGFSFSKLMYSSIVLKSAAWSKKQTVAHIGFSPLTE